VTVPHGRIETTDIYYAFAIRQFWQRRYVFQAVRLSVRSSVCLSGQILLPQYLPNSLSNLDKTYREYSLAPTDNLIRFWRTEVKVTAGCQGGEGIHVSAEA